MIERRKKRTAKLYRMTAVSGKRSPTIAEIIAATSRPLPQYSNNILLDSTIHVSFEVQIHQLLSSIE